LKTKIRISPSGKERVLFSITIENSFKFPDFVTCLAVSMTLRRVNCSNKIKEIENLSAAV
jgi:hypothetical protein